MLCRDPHNRPSAAALLNHHWLRAALELPDQFDQFDPMVQPALDLLATGAAVDATAAAAAAKSAGVPIGERRYRRFSAVMPGALDRLRRFNAKRKFRAGAHRGSAFSPRASSSLRVALQGGAMKKPGRSTHRHRSCTAIACSSADAVWTTAGLPFSCYAQMLIRGRIPYFTA